MFGTSSGELRNRTLVGITEVISCMVLVYIGSGGLPVGPSDHTTSLPPLGGGVISGVFVAGAACAAVVSWRRHAGTGTGWIVATGALVAAQSLLVTLVALDAPDSRPTVTLVLLAAVLVGLVAVLRPLVTLHRTSHVVDDGFAIGLGMGLVAAAHLLLQLPLSSPLTGPEALVVAFILATHLTATAVVLRQGALSRPMAWLLVGTVVVVDVGQLVHVSGADSAGWLMAASIARGAAGAAWLIVAWVMLRRALEEDHRRIETVEHALVSTTRDQRERMHELRSTVAGLITGSAMLDRDDVPAELRERLWSSVRRELDRMDRLLCERDEHVEDIDLDEALGLIIDLQRLKGRHVEFRSNGDVVRARFDALAEVVNILMDNAAVHGGTDSSVVEVVRRDESHVDITVTDFGRGIPREQRATIFDWGQRGSTSPGEGIGLNLAQRLMTEDGGSLRLADDAGVGSSFVITLPAARRSPEDAVVGAER